jgi:Matrixin
MGSVVGEARAYQTGADKAELAGTAKVRWATNLVPYTLNDQVPVGLTFEEVEEVAQRAFAVWSAPVCSGIVFSNASNTSDPARPGDGVNTIQWLFSGWQERGFDPAAPGITDVQYGKDEQGNWQIVEADTYLNAETQHWIKSGEQEGYVDLESVLVHESGHMLGLLHPCEPGGANGAPDCAAHPELTDDTMYPFYGAGEATLAPDDEAGVCFLYPGSDCEITGCPSGNTCRPEGCLTPCGASFCAVGEQCVEGACKGANVCSGDACGRSGCQSDGDCTANQQCKTGSCVGRLPSGDPCASDQDCAGGVCVEGAYCAAGCRSDVECAEGATCTKISSGKSACLSGKVPLGAPCDAANECIGGRCLARDGEAPLCTRSCEEAACPAGWECAEVDGQNVCQPPAAGLPAACAVEPRRPARRAEWFVLFFASLLLRRRRPDASGQFATSHKKRPGNRHPTVE